MPRIVYCQDRARSCEQPLTMGQGPKPADAGERPKGEGGSAEFDLSTYGITLGTSIRAVADVGGGEQGHESADNVTYDDSGQVCTYSLSGTVFKVWFDLALSSMTHAATRAPQPMLSTQ